MEVAILSEKTLKIKGKTSTIIIDPLSTISKVEAQGVLYSHPKESSFSESKIEGSRLAIEGPGEYEVGGVKVLSLKANGGLVFLVEVDTVKILVGSGSEILDVHENIESYHILVINADSEFNYSSLTSLEPKVLLIYGPKSGEVKKVLGKEALENSSKYSTTFEKLPGEMQLMVLEK